MKRLVLLAALASCTVSKDYRELNKAISAEAQTLLGRWSLKSVPDQPKPTGAQLELYEFMTGNFTSEERLAAPGVVINRYLGSMIGEYPDYDGISRRAFALGGGDFGGHVSIERADDDHLGEDDDGLGMEVDVVARDAGDRGEIGRMVRDQQMDQMSLLLTEEDGKVRVSGAGFNHLANIDGKTLNFEKRFEEQGMTIIHSNIISVKNEELSLVQTTLVTKGDNNVDLGTMTALYSR